MKLLGAALVLAGALWACLLRRREAMAPIRTGRALLADLSVLRYEICVLRRPLPQLLAEDLAAGEAAPFWRRLGEELDRAGETGASPADCWRAASAALPPPVGRRTAPLGDLLAAGGGRLDAAIEETREELARYVREETVRQAQQGRLTAALCLSGALLLILVMV